MKLITINSGSSGNGYVLTNEAETLVLECGMPLKDVAQAVSNNIKSIVGCLVTHSHGDHAKYVLQYAKSFRIFTTKGTFAEKHLAESDFHVECIEYGRMFSVGNFQILPFKTIHDTIEPCGYLIKHPDIGTLLFATDTQRMLYKFNNLHLNHIMIECNHSTSILQQNVTNGVYPRSVAQRIVDNHMSVDRCVSFLGDCSLADTQEIVLLHLSENNSNPPKFQDVVARGTGKPVYIATRGLVIDLSLNMGAL